VLKREISVCEKAIAALEDYSFDPETGGFVAMGVSPSCSGVGYG
jgi:hypothetical protein